MLTIAHPRAIAPTRRATKTRDEDARRTSRPARAVIARASRDDAHRVDRRAATAAIVGVFLAATPLGARAGDEGSYTSKVSAKEARKAEILAAARAKAAANASAPEAPKAELTNAEMFRTDDPGRGGGKDAPRTANAPAEE